MVCNGVPLTIRFSPIMRFILTQLYYPCSPLHPPSFSSSINPHSLLEVVDLQSMLAKVRQRRVTFR